jgi:hypothetical protein
LPRPLKVFRTAVGFRDAYVAAPSKAAALRAWGTEKDLFARGSAEEVTDAALTQDALSKPGEVVYRTRGGLEEQVAALGKLPERKASDRQPDEPAPSKAKPARKPARPPRPRPSRAELEASEAAIAALQQERDRADAELRARELALAAERKTTEARFAKQLEELQRKQEQARRTYEAALRKWEP